MVTGFLRTLPEPGSTQVIIDHGDIPGFRSAMASPLPFRDAGEFAGLQAGDPVSFRLVTGEDGIWIEDVVAIPSGTVAVPAAESPSAGARPGTTPRVREGDPLPAFSLVDQRGRTITPATFAGEPLVMTFIFTRCAVMEFCPHLSAQFAEVRDAAAADPELRGRVHLLSVSFDEADTPEMLAEYGAHFAADPDQWRLATGEPSEIQSLISAFALRVERDTERDTIDHSLATALVDEDGVVREIWRGNSWRPEEVVAALRGVLRSDS